MKKKTKICSCGIGPNTHEHNKPEMKHTPGPWHLNGNSAWADSCKDRGAIFECRLQTGTHIPEDQNLINAKLLAAAPELLELAKKWHAYDDEGHKAVMPDCRWCKIIAKAEGK